MSDIADIFRVALNIKIKDNHGAQTELAHKTGFSLSKIHSLTSGARGGRVPEDTRRLIAAALGYPGHHYEDFLDMGRRALKIPVVAKNATTAPTPEVAAVLEKARAVLEGPKGEALKTVIESMSKE